MSILNQVATGLRSEVTVFGGDYAIRDGTGIRDYIHVVDLATGHLKAWNRLASTRGVEVCNLGTGMGVSALEAIRAVEAASGADIAFTFAARRRGDVAERVADPSKANTILDWIAKFNLADMAEDGWRW